MVLKALGVNPLLVVKSNSNSDGVLGYLKIAFLFFRNRFGFTIFITVSWFFLLVFFLFSLCFEHPGKWGYSAADSTVFAIPISSHFAYTFLTMSLKLDALDGRIVKATSADDEVSSAFNRSKIGFNFLNFNVIVSERDRFAGELLTVEGYIYVVTHVISLERI